MEAQIEEAIRAAVERHGQPDEVANKIIAWMRELASGNEQIEDGQVALQRVGTLYEATVAVDAGGDE